MLRLTAETDRKEDVGPINLIVLSRLPRHILTANLLSLGILEIKSEISEDFTKTLVRKSSTDGNNLILKFIG